MCLWRQGSRQQLRVYLLAFCGDGAFHVSIMQIQETETGESVLHMPFCVLNRLGYNPIIEHPASSFLPFFY